MDNIHPVDNMRVAATAVWAALLAAYDVRAAADGSGDPSSAVIGKHYIVEYEPVSNERPPACFGIPQD